MARYTIELREIVKSGFNIFNFPYNFYDESKKKDFEEKFIHHFYFREIGSETVGRFCHYLEDTFTTKLPYYNELLKISVMEYDKINNYDLTETYTKSANKASTVSGNGSVNGSANENTENSSHVNRSIGSVLTGEHTNTLNSTTDHTEDQSFTKNDEITEKTDTTKTTTHDVDNKHVESETPSGLLAMTDIKTNVYASKAIIDDNLDKLTDTDKVTGTKTGESTENTDRTVKDIVGATTRDTSTTTNDEDHSETATGDTSSNSTFNNVSSTSQTATGNESENYTRRTVGNIGVQTNADSLLHDIKLQEVITRIYQNFFDECDDLFMQIYSF